MSASQTSQSPHSPSAATSPQPASQSSTGRRRTRQRGYPPPRVTRSSGRSGRLSSPDDAGPSQSLSSAMKSRTQRHGTSPLTASTASASSVGGKLRVDPLLDLLIGEKEKLLKGVALLEEGSAQDVEGAARQFLETSRRCFQTSMDAMDFEEAEIESDCRSEERDNVMSTWDDMLLAGRVFFDCNQYEVAVAEEVKDGIQKRNNVLTDKASLYLDKGIALFNAMVLVKNISLPDSVTTDLEQLGAGTAPARVSARNAVLKNLWASFWHIVPDASTEELELWVQFSVQLSGRFQSHKIYEDERVKASDLPGPPKGAFWGKNVFPNYSNLDQDSDRFRELMAQWTRLKNTARPKSIYRPPHWQSLEDSVVGYIWKKSDELLNVYVEEEADQDAAAHTDEGEDVMVAAARPPPALGDEGESPPPEGVEDDSMAEPIDMDLFLELAQELEAEKAVSSPLAISPRRRTLTPLIRLGPERPTPSFDWNARQKDAAQISWETQELNPPSRPVAHSHHSSSQDRDDLPGETQLRGAVGAVACPDGTPEASPSGHAMDSDDELPTATQLQGESLAPYVAVSDTHAAESQDPDRDDLPPHSLLDGESEAFAESEINRDEDDNSSLEDNDFPTETQLRGYGGAFAEPQADSEPATPGADEEDVFPSETQLHGDGNALALPSNLFEPLAEEEVDVAIPETDDLPEPDQFEGDDDAFATQVAGAELGNEQSDVNIVPDDAEEGSLPDPDNELPGMDELAGDYVALTGTNQAADPVRDPSQTIEDDGHHAPNELQKADASPSPGSFTGEAIIEGSSSTRDLAEHNRPSVSQAAVAPVANDEEGVAADRLSACDDLPSAEQLQGETGAWTAEAEMEIAEHLEGEIFDNRERGRSISSPDSDPSERQQHPGAALDSISGFVEPDHLVVTTNDDDHELLGPLDGAKVSAESVNVGLEELGAELHQDTASATGRSSQGSQSASSPEVLPEEATAQLRRDVPGIVRSAVLLEMSHEEVAVSTSVTATGPSPTGSKTSEAQHVPASRLGPGPPSPSTGTRLSYSRRAPDPRTEFATPDPEDGPVEHVPSASAAASENLHGPRRTHRLRTDSPTRRSKHFLPPMLLPVVPHHGNASSRTPGTPRTPKTPRTPSQSRAQESGLSLLRSSIMRSASTVRRVDSPSSLRTSRQQAVTKVRSEGAASVDADRRSRSVTGRLGYLAPQNDPYLHDQDGGPLEPDEDYVTPDVYPMPPQERTERRTRVPMHRKSRRWTEAEALLLYRTVQKAWWSERTAQQVVWYLHGEWGQMSQKLKAFTVQNMKDKMREIVKTRVRNDRAVVGRARHWLPVGHPDRDAYEEEMAAWADAENERLQREQEEQEEEEERKALEEACEADDEVMAEDESVTYSIRTADEVPDEEMDWEANPELLVDVGGDGPTPPHDSEDEDSAGELVTREIARRAGEHSLRRSVREPLNGAHWRTDNEDDEGDELESEPGNSEPAEDAGENISVADSDLGMADPTDFPSPIDIAALLNSRKRRSSEAQSRTTPKRRHTFGTQHSKPPSKPQARPSLPAIKRRLITYTQQARPQHQLQSCESDSSEDQALLRLPSLRTRPSDGTPSSPPRGQGQRPVLTEPRPSRRSASAAREAISRGAQSSPSHPLRSRHGPRPSPSVTESESPDRSDVGASQMIARRASSRASTASQRRPASPTRLGVSSPADEIVYDAGHHSADAGSSSDGFQDDTQVSLGNTQPPEYLAPRTTVVARARRGRGGFKHGLSRPLSAVAERTESVESRRGRSAPAGPEEGSSSSRETAEEGAEEVEATPRPSQRSRLREIARKVMGV